MLIRSFAVITAQIVLAAFAIVAFAGTAEAAFITFVASNGNDANPCTVVTAPCRTLTRAYNVTTANGTIRVLTPLQNNLFIAKNITVEGNGAAIVGFFVIANANAVVTLRGLALNGVGGFVNCIRIDSAAAVHIENCTVERYTGDGIKLSASTATKLFVSDTVSRDNGGNGFFVNDANALVEVDNSRFENNGTGLSLLAAKMTLIRSVASGNFHGIDLSNGTANVTDTTASDNTVRGFAFFGNVAATVASSLSRGNQYGMTLASTASVSITDSVITSNTSYAIYNEGTLYTRQNNTLGGSTFGPAAIPFAAY